MQSLLQKSTASRGQVVVRAEKKGFSFSLPTTTKKVAAGTKPTPKSTGTTRSGGVGYRKYQGDALWLPNTARPQWLDGSLPGDRGFDPLGLSRPSDFVQIALDGNDQNKAVNLKGTPEGSIGSVADELTQNSFQPYSEVFGLQRFRECELIHGRWAMLACLGAVVAEATTGVSWAEAGKVELDGASYAGFALPFSITQLVWIEVLAVGGAEIYRNGALEPERRCYPGGVFDPLGLASGDDERAFRLKTAEIKHGRLAMIGFLGYGVQALSTGEGALGSLAKFTDSLAASS